MRRVLEMELLAVGKLKEGYLRQAQDALSSRIAGKTRFSLRELSDQRILENASPKEEEKVKEEEGQRILNSLIGNPYLIALDLQGNALDSASFRQMVLQQGETRKITFLIGGSLGLSEAVLAKCHRRVRFSPMTYPHQLFRIILLDEVARALES